MADILETIGNNGPLGKVLCELFGQIAASAIVKTSEQDKRSIGGSMQNNGTSVVCKSVNKTEESNKSPTACNRNVDSSLGRPRYQWNTPENADAASSKLTTSGLKQLYSVYVGHLPTDITEDELADLFCDIGEVVNCFVFPTSNNRAYTYGFVRFHTLDEAKDAVRQKNSKLLGGQPINVELSSSTKRQLQSEEEGTPLLRKDYPQVPRPTKSESDEKQVVEQLRASLRRLNSNKSSIGNQSPEEVFDSIKAILKMLINYPMSLADPSAEVDKDKSSSQSTETKPQPFAQDSLPQMQSSEAVNHPTAPQFQITSRLPSFALGDAKTSETNIKQPFDNKKESSYPTVPPATTFVQNTAPKSERADSSQFKNKVREFLDFSSGEDNVLSITSEHPNVPSSKVCMSASFTDDERYIRRSEYHNQSPSPSHTSNMPPVNRTSNDDIGRPQFVDPRNRNDEIKNDGNFSPHHNGQTASVTNSASSPSDGSDEDTRYPVVPFSAQDVGNMETVTTSERPWTHSKAKVWELQTFFSEQNSPDNSWPEDRVVTNESRSASNLKHLSENIQSSLSQAPRTFDQQAESPKVVNQTTQGSLENSDTSNFNTYSRDLLPMGNKPCSNTPHSSKSSVVEISTKKDGMLCDSIHLSNSVTLSREDSLSPDIDTTTSSDGSYLSQNGELHSQSVTSDVSSPEQKFLNIFQTNSTKSIAHGSNNNKVAKDGKRAKSSGRRVLAPSFSFSPPETTSKARETKKTDLVYEKPKLTMGSKLVDDLSPTSVMVNDSSILSVSKNDSPTPMLDVSEFDFGFEDNETSPSVKLLESRTRLLDTSNPGDDVETIELKEEMKRRIRKLEELQEILAEHSQQREHKGRPFEEVAQCLELQARIHDAEILLQKKEERWKARSNETEVAYEKEALRCSDDDELLSQFAREIRKDTIRHEIYITDMKCQILELRIEQSRLEELLNS